MEEITFKNFSRLGAERGWTVEMLTERFQDKIDRPRDFFERALSRQWRNPDTARFEDRSDVVIPYRSVLQFYFTELKTWQDSTGRTMPITLAQKQQRLTARNQRRTQIGV